eukprot:CAMPEP_0116142506 /NCGR_PEP_ID=MMETSP0329-20121206/14945_1 /TAXON_ID=697910 /ORGANISM="Pseudo-nitzschia arenysensis, Strain B593" /LENGTH=308 /DNA_ID=CAMNT_0003637747 /DNA_START=217 /DNA_END=1142 /DNA_ORIENTATION=+
MPSIGRGLPTRKGKASSSGSRRRSRGLPLASGGTSGSPNNGKSSPTSSIDSPAPVLSSSSLSRRNSLSGGNKKKNSGSPAIKTESTPSNLQTLKAKLDKADAIKFNGSRSGSTDWTVELILDGGKSYNQAGSGSSDTLNAKLAEGESTNSRPRRTRTDPNDANTSKMKNDDDDTDIPRSDTASPSPPVRESSFTKRVKGKDGNFHFCKICREVGDVVCCDGCPQVYHPQCLPADSESFAALDLQHDDDPWYCPDCVEKRKKDDQLKKKNKKRKAAGSPSNEMVSPYRQSRPKRKCSYDVAETIGNEMK